MGPLHKRKFTMDRPKHIKEDIGTYACDVAIWQFQLHNFYWLWRRLTLIDTDFVQMIEAHEVDLKQEIYHLELLVQVGKATKIPRAKMHY